MALVPRAERWNASTSKRNQIFKKSAFQNFYFLMAKFVADFRCCGWAKSGMWMATLQHILEENAGMWLCLVTEDHFQGRSCIQCACGTPCVNGWRAVMWFTGGSVGTWEELPHEAHSGLFLQNVAKGRHHPCSIDIFTKKMSMEGTSKGCLLSLLVGTIVLPLDIRGLEAHVRKPSSEACWALHHL